MELKEFISESLSQILDGINEASKKLETTSKHPIIYNPGQIRNNAFDQTEKIEFEVIVDVESKDTKKGGAKITVFSIGVGAEADKSLTHTQQNKIKFSVPVCFTKATPTQKE